VTVVVVLYVLVLGRLFTILQMKLNVKSHHRASVNTAQLSKHDRELHQCRLSALRLSGHSDGFAVPWLPFNVGELLLFTYIAAIMYTPAVTRPSSHMPFQRREADLPCY
jgi:hypothetical protein